MKTEEVIQALEYAVTEIKTLRAQVEVLQAENRDLLDEVERAKMYVETLYEKENRNYGGSE